MKTKGGGFRIGQDLDQALAREWLEVNRFGGTASSTVAGINTRRSHGLLAVPGRPSDGCYTQLNSMEETLYINDLPHPVSTHIYPGTFHPEGWRSLHEFCLFPFPAWIFHIGDVVLVKSLIFVHAEETAVIHYQVLGGDQELIRLEVRPLLALRTSENLSSERRGFQPFIKMLKPGLIEWRANPETASLFFHHDAAVCDQSGLWRRRIQYPMEQAQGLDFEEDLYSPFRLGHTFLKAREIFLCVSTVSHQAIDPDTIFTVEKERKRELWKDTEQGESPFSSMIRAARLISGKQGLIGTAVERDPWFETGTRDLLLACQGLLLAREQYELARAHLVQLAGRVRAGLLPVSPTLAGSETGGADLPLWFIYCVAEYLKHSEDDETVERHLFDAAQSIIDCWVKGMPGIRLGSDALVSVGCDGTAMTWMDQRAGRTMVTPRIGKPVEIQALWYNALCEMAFLADHFGKSSLKKNCEHMASSAKQSFNQLFWMPRPRGKAFAGYLYDVAGEQAKDATLRPNQLLALGLSFPILEENAEKWNAVLNVTKQHLLTPYGLRTLAPDDSHYHPTCDGDRSRRQWAYGQGSVWACFLVPFAVAFFRVHGYSKQTKEELFKYFRPLWQRIADSGFGFVSEICDGAPPHQPRGCVVSAAALAAALEIYEMLTDRSRSRRKAHILTLR